ncbi:MAG: dTMP kinase [Clostridiales bacterium]|nr:dTMP kinase [Clostridiales bacterium]
MGKFIVFEGLDGSGKSSQINILADELRRRGEKVYVTAEPTDGETGRYLRRILSQSLKKDMHLQAALFLADRIEHITDPETGIKKYLDDGYTVLCDRYYYSSLSYQGKSGKCDFDWVFEMNMGCEKLLKPDICFFLDVYPKTCKERIEETRDNVELYEKSIELMSNTRCGFMEVFSLLEKEYGHNIVCIDANDSIDNISKEIMKHV